MREIITPAAARDTHKQMGRVVARISRTCKGVETSFCRFVSIANDSNLDERQLCVVLSAYQARSPVVKLAAAWRKCERASSNEDAQQLHAICPRPLMMISHLKACAPPLPPPMAHQSSASANWTP